MISIVIPTLKEEDYIRKTIQRIQGLEFKKGVEIIVVDSSPDDLTRKAVKDLDVKVFIERKKIIGRGKWRGFGEAKGEIIVSLDADALISQEWVNQVERLYEEKIVAITGPFFYYDATHFSEKIFGQLVVLGDFLRRIFIYRHPPLRGGNMAIKRGVYFQAGEFDKNRRHREDSDLSYRVKKLGKIIYSRKMRPGFSTRRLRGGVLRYFWEYSNNFLVDALKIKRKKYQLSVVR